MAITKQSKDLQIDSIQETLLAAEMCLNFDKGDEKWTGINNSGCLGIPCLILLSSLIDTMGSMFRGSDLRIMIDETVHNIVTASDHFMILNDVRLFNLNLSMLAIEDLYKTYRCKLTHNNTLPENNFLNIDKPHGKLFEYNDEGLISVINLTELLGYVKKAVPIIIIWINEGTFSEEHKVTTELYELNKYRVPLTVLDIASTGNTMTIITNEMNCG